MTFYGNKTRFYSKRKPRRVNHTLPTHILTDILLTKLCSVDIDIIIASVIANQRCLPCKASHAWTLRQDVEFCRVKLIKNNCINCENSSLTFLPQLQLFHWLSLNSQFCKAISYGYYWLTQTNQQQQLLANNDEVIPISCIYNANFGCFEISLRPSCFLGHPHLSAHMRY